jgi:hypothetical protein
MEQLDSRISGFADVACRRGRNSRPVEVTSAQPPVWEATYPASYRVRCREAHGLDDPNLGPNPGGVIEDLGDTPSRAPEALGVSLRHNRTSGPPIVVLVLPRYRVTRRAGSSFRQLRQQSSRVERHVLSSAALSSRGAQCSNQRPWHQYLTAKF